MNVKAENEFLRRALAVRRLLLRFLDQNGSLGSEDSLTARFTLDGKESYPVSERQKALLMEEAPEGVRKLNALAGDSQLTAAVHPEMAFLAQKGDVADRVGLADVPGDDVMILEGAPQGAISPAGGAFSLIADGDLGLDMLRDVPGHTPALLFRDGKPLKSPCRASITDAGVWLGTLAPPAVDTAVFPGHDIIIKEKGRKKKVKTDDYWEEIRRAIGKGTRSLLRGTSTRALNRALEEIRAISEQRPRCMTVKFPSVTRFEVIDHTNAEVVWYAPDVPRSVVARSIQVELAFQDEGSTLKVFLTDRE